MYFLRRLLCPEIYRRGITKVKLFHLTTANVISAKHGLSAHVHSNNSKHLHGRRNGKRRRFSVIAIMPMFSSAKNVTVAFLREVFNPKPPFGYQRFGLSIGLTTCVLRSLCELYVIIRLTYLQCSLVNYRSSASDADYCDWWSRNVGVCLSSLSLPTCHMGDYSPDGATIRPLLHTEL